MGCEYHNATQKSCGPDNLQLKSVFASGGFTASPLTLTAYLHTNTLHPLTAGCTFQGQETARTLPTIKHVSAKTTGSKKFPDFSWNCLKQLR